LRLLSMLILHIGHCATDSVGNTNSAVAKRVNMMISFRIVQR